MYGVMSRMAPTTVYVESVQGQALFAQLIRGIIPATVPVLPRASKEMRFLPVQALYRMGCVYHMRSLRGSMFESQLLAFPSGEHDDAVDALAYAILPYIAAPMYVQHRLYWLL